MTNLSALNDLLHQKIEKQVLLKEKFRQMDTIDTNLMGSRIGRWFGSSYLVVKRIITLLLGISLLIMSIFLLISPENVFGERTKQELIQDSKDEYTKMLGQTIGETIVASFKNGNSSADKIDREFNRAIDHIIELEIYSAIRFFALLLIPLAFFFLYISRLTRKMRLRNHKISETQSLTQEIITSYKEDMKGLEKEIEIIRNILHPQPFSKPAS